MTWDSCTVVQCTAVNVSFLLLLLLLSAIKEGAGNTFLQLADMSHQTDMFSAHQSFIS
jgi:hypothetical protein